MARTRKLAKKQDRPLPGESVWNTPHIHSLILLHRNPHRPISKALATGNVAFVRAHWADFHRDIDVETEAIRHAARGNNPALLDWLWDSCDEVNQFSRDALLADACTLGHTAILTWRGVFDTFHPTARHADTAAAHGHIPLLQWLYTHKACHVSSDGLVAAARSSLPALRWLLEHDASLRDQ